LARLWLNLNALLPAQDDLQGPDAQRVAERFKEQGLENPQLAD
jgi:hypothetical protein